MSAYENTGVLIVEKDTKEKLRRKLHREISQGYEVVGFDTYTSNGVLHYTCILKRQR